MEDKRASNGLKAVLVDGLDVWNRSVQPNTSQVGSAPDLFSHQKKP